ncbi:50S ribosomal protein L4 [Candidatus Woesearchaeota archaeon]|nr:50S ribosomal protein L4 [Candidatus Woesearchaeota archaeon]
MKLEIISGNKEKKGSIDMPEQFSEHIRKDIIKKAFEAESAGKRQPYGASPEAGFRHSTFASKRRHNYRGTYGIGQSRTPRKILSRSGERMNWEGAFAPQTVGGRRAHPPKAKKMWKKKINKKERNLAIRSAMAATLSRELAEKRGHVLPEEYPFIINDSICGLTRTRQLKEFLDGIDFGSELQRAKEKKVRAGKGKSRGRKYKRKKSLLIIVEGSCPLISSGKNMPGIDIIDVKDLDVSVLAPGAVPGRLTLWTSKAVQKIAKDNLFI